MSHTVKNLPAMQETWVWWLGWEDPMEKGYGHPLQYREFHEQRSLADYSTWGHKELDTTEHFHFSDTFTDTMGCLPK